MLKYIQKYDIIIKEIDLYTNTKKVKQYYENLKKGEATFNI